MSSPFDRQPKRDKPSKDNQPSTPGESTQNQLLQQVLEQTLLSLGGSEPPAEEDVKALRQLANRRRGEAFGLEPVAVEMVEAVLRGHFDRQPARRAMAAQIAATLYEDPASHDRLRALWAQLCEAHT